MVLNMTDKAMMPKNLHEKLMGSRTPFQKRVWVACAAILVGLVGVSCSNSNSDAYRVPEGKTATEDADDQWRSLNPTQQGMVCDGVKLAKEIGEYDLMVEEVSRQLGVTSSEVRAQYDAWCGVN